MPDKTDPASEAARLLGRRGGRANTDAQRAARTSPKPWAGRPKGAKNKPKPRQAVGPVACGPRCLTGESGHPGQLCGEGRLWSDHTARVSITPRRLPEDAR